MKVLQAFMSHELRTQLRSPRFHGVTIAYLLLSIAPALAAYFIARSSGSVAGGAFYGAFMDALQPICTTLFGALIGVDIILRERDESSLAVVAMAPLSATGYILRRWLSLLAVLLPITLLPRLVACGLLLHADGVRADVAPILLGWTVHVVPLLAVVTALSMALGAITGRTVLALMVGAGLFTIGLGITNDLLAFARRQLSGVGEFFGVSPEVLIWLNWRFYDATFPSAAGYPLVRNLEETLLHGALAAGVTALFVGIACSYLRRTKRDLRPWPIRKDHQLRSFLRLMNRIREEFSPDGGREVPERIILAAGIVVAGTAVALLMRRHDTFERLAAERYASEQRGVDPMPITIVPVAASLQGRISRDGVLEATATLILRNDGTTMQRELAFALNRGIAIENVSASRGDARLDRLWERVAIALRPPLAPQESRNIAFVLRGAPGGFNFSLPGGSSHGAQWRRYADATKSFDLADLSRSTVERSASRHQLLLGGSELIPTPRYSPWDVVPLPRTWRRQDAPKSHFVSDGITPPTALSIDLDVPDDFLAADSCGTATRREIFSRCTFPISDYVLVASRFDVMTNEEDVRLAYLPTHASVASSHATALSGAIALAMQSWPTFTMHERAIFVERPALLNEGYYGEWVPTHALRAIETHGALSLLPEPMFIRRKPMDQPVIAASLIAGSLEARRPVVTTEQAFFRKLYELIATWSTGGSKRSAVEPGTGGRPQTEPILQAGRHSNDVRFEKVFADVEYRVGNERLVQGIEEFVSAGPSPGNAKELLQTIGRQAEVSLDRVYSDFFTGSALPRLTLADVTFHRSAAGWEVRGTVTNEGEGEVFCPVVLRTAAGSVRTTVRVDSNESAPFVLGTIHTPRTVQLDPEDVVYRHAVVGATEFVDYTEGP